MFNPTGKSSPSKTYRKCTVKYVGSRHVIVKDENGREFSRKKACIDIKPLPSKREEFLDEISDIWKGQPEPLKRALGNRIYDEGYRKVKPLSWDEFDERNYADTYKWLSENNHIVEN